jgi:hypothetical protein
MSGRHIALGIVAMTVFGLLGVAQARAGNLYPLYANNFDGDVGTEWSPNTTAVTPVGGRRFLGQFGAQGVTLTLNNLRLHGYIWLSCDLFIIGSWDGNYVSPGTGPDIWDLSAEDGTTVVHTTFNTHTFASQYQAFPDFYPGGQHPSNTGAIEVNTLGYSCSGSCTNAVYHLDLLFVHRSHSMVLTFSGLGLESLANESWGLDNLTIQIESPPPPDFDGDGDLDQFDLAYFFLCMEGPGTPPAGFPGCESADIDGDSDVDQADFGFVQRCMSGYDVPVDPYCTEAKIP